MGFDKKLWWWGVILVLLGVGMALCMLPVEAQSPPTKTPAPTPEAAPPLPSWRSQ